MSSNKLWCQMCGKTVESILPRATCPSCGAMLVRVPVKDALLARAEQGERDAQIWRHNAENWFARAERAEALNQRLVEALKELIDGFEIDDAKLNSLIAEWKESEK